MKKQHMKGKNKLILLLILLLLLVAIVLTFGIISKETSIFGAKSRSNKVLQYYDENTVFVLFTKYLDENQTVVSPTSVQTQTVNQLDYEIEIPEIDGYTPLVDELSGVLDQEGIAYLESLDYVKIVVKDNIYNIYITITYDAAPSAYTVVYYEQNADLSGYTEVNRETIGGTEGNYTGEIYTGDEITISPEEKTGFYLNTEKTKLTGKVQAFGAKTFEIYYDRTPYYLYTFNTGDSYYEPMIFRYGQTVTLSEEPTYSGYVFDGWEYSTSMDGEKITKPDTMPAYNIYAEAKWIRSDTHYTLSYYTQNADNDEYTNIGTIEVAAISGDNLKDEDQDSLKTIIENGFSTVRGDTAEYYYYNEEKTKLENNDFDIVIQGKGITVVPIYFDRQVYNVTLDFNDDSYNTAAEVEMGGTTYTDSYTFQARYEQNLLEHWITANDFTTFPKSSSRTYYFKGWQAPGNSTTYVSLRLTLTSTMIEDADSNRNIVYNAQYTTSSTSRQLLYLFESFDQSSAASGDTRRLYNGTYYDVANEYSQTVYTTSSMSAKEITGVTNVGQQSSNGKYYFYYDRNVLQITLYNMNNVYIEKELLYGQSMEEFVDTQLNPEDFSLETPGTKDWIFEGWYQDSNYMVPMVWTNEDGTYKTITDNLVLYAKWSAPTYTVTFNTNGGAWTETDSRYVKVDDNTYTLTVTEGESLVRPTNPTKLGNVAAAWNYDVNSESVEYLFSDSQKVYSDLNLDLQYTPNTNIPYRVRYIEAQYKNGVLVEDISQYENIVDLAPAKEVYNNAFGTTVEELPLDIYDNENEDNYFVVNLRSETLTLTSEDIDDNVIYFLYAKNPIVPYTVYYVKYQEDDQGNPIRYDYGDIPSDDVLLGKKDTTVAAGYATEIADDIDGWTINGSYSQTIKLTLKASLNTMYFYYNENTTGEYLVNFFFMNKSGQYSETPDYTYTSEDAAGKVLYGTDFDKFTFENGATDADYVGRVYDTEKSNEAYLIVTTTSEVSAMDIYFKNVNDLTYTVKYVDEAGNELHPNKVVENQMYLSEVTENAIDIYGYELVNGETAQKTIQLGVNTNEIVFTYKKLDNISYTVNYYEEGTTNPVAESDIVANNEFASTVNISAIEIPGYRLADGEINSKNLTLNSVDNNEITFYYVKRDDINYTVEYYYDGSIDTKKTATFEATFKNIISTYADKNITGYKLDRTENVPLTISATESDNVIKIYYVKDKFDYTVEYYYDGNIDTNKTETIEATYQDEITTYTDKNITGYRLDKTENVPLTVSEVESNNVVKVYYVKDNFDYAVEYYYDGTINAEKTEIMEATYMDVISTYTNKNITGYRFDKVEGTPLTVTENESTNVIKVYYVKDKFDYTVEYYYDGTINTEKTERIEATYQDVIESYTDKNITGYRLDKVEGTPLTVTENESTNVIKVYYVKDKFDYTVEYYYDGTINTEKTETIEATYQDVIESYTEKNITGYRFDKVEGTPLTITENESTNVIKVYYVKDKFDYTVKYYYDGKLDSSKTEALTATYQDEITTYEDKNITGYRLNKTENLPLTISEVEENNVINIFYVKDNFDYTVEYYYDGNIEDSKTDTITATYQDVISTYTDKNIAGYRFDKVEGTPLTITEIESNNVIKVYYVKDNFDYTVKYYYDGNIEDSKTDTITATYQDVISTYTDKNITGYRLDATENVPLTISEVEENNVINIFYVKDNFDYTVEYYYDGNIDDSKTDAITATYQDVISTYTDKNITGYRLDREEGLPLIVTENESTNVIKVYYVKDNFDYTVEYYYDGNIDTEKTETIEATYQEVIESYTDKNITGYRFDKVEGTPLTITEIEANNVIKVYYVKDNFDYTVKYYYDGNLDEEKTDVITATYKDVVSTYTDKNITGYRLEKTENLPLTISENEENNVIKIYYIVDDGNTKTLSYTVEYYKDGEIVDSDTQTVNQTVQILQPDILRVKKEEINLNNKYTGYRLDNTNPESIPDTIADGEVIKVYYVKDNFDYTVEYYYDGNKDDNKTEVITATYQDEVITYEDKNITGYRLDREEGLPLTITENESTNVIRVYYVKDNFDYTVEYYYDGNLDESKTEVLTAIYQDEITTYTDKNITGYRLDKTENLPLTINEIEENNIIKVYYVKDNFDYTVKYYYDGSLDSSKTEVLTATYQDEITTYEDKNITGYRLDATENVPLIVSEIEENNVINIFYVKDNFDYAVEYYYDGNLDSSKTEVLTAIYQDEITIYEDKNITGYRLDKTENLPLTISEIEENNIIKVYYVKDNFDYAVEYYYDENLDEGKTEVVTATYMDVIDTYIDKNITGYRLDKTENLPLTISEIEEKNIIKVYYVKDNFDYTIEYYYDGNLDESKTEVITATYQDKITTYADKNIAGYRLEKTEKLPLMVSEIEENNVIKVYYIVDDGNTKTLSYTVEYYKDGEIVDSDTQTVNQTVQILQPDILTVKKEEINLNNKYTGYRLDNTDPESIPDTIADGEVIKVYYVKDNFDYTVEYYYDGNKDDNKTEVITATYQDEITTYEDKNITGYRLDREEGLPLTVTENESTNVIRVYYVKDNFDYAVEYYYDGIIDDNETEVINATYQDEITTYTDKNITGYRLEKTENLPLTVSEIEENNVIKVYYVKDTFDYTVEYYYDETIDSGKTDTFTATYMDVISTYIDKNIIGYRFDNVENTPLTITENESTNVIRVYYVKDNFDYAVEYYYDGIIDDNETEVITATYMDIIATYEDKNITGYRLEKTENLPLIVSEIEENNVIKVYYVKDNFDYTVEYYYDETIDRSKTDTFTATYQDEITTYEDKNITGYRFDNVENTPLTITENENTNVIRVYYVKDNFNYTVEYYYSGVIDESKTDAITATYMDIISTYTDKNIAGHRLEKTENVPLTVTEIEENNIIKVYYIVDDGNTKDLSYTVEYYKDGILLENDTQTVIQTVQVLQPDTLTVKKEEINITNKYLGYKLDKIEPSTIPDTVNNGDVIKVYYVKDQIQYTVNYYFDGVLDTSVTETNKAEFMSKVETFADKSKYGYRFDSTENLPLIIGAYPENNIINVNYVRKDSEVVVEYRDKYSKEEISELVKLPGKVFDKFGVAEHQKNVEGYTLIDVPEEMNGQFEEEVQTKTFYYAKNTNVIVKHLEKETDAILATEEIISGYVGKEYTTNQVTVENYTFAEKTTNTEGIMTEEPITVIYYYAQNTSVVVNHIDQNSGEILDTIEGFGKAGDEYETASKNFEGYILLQKPESEKVIMAKEIITVNYYYAKISEGILEKHIDINSDEILHNEVTTGNEGLEYSIDSMEFEGYDIVTNLQYYRIMTEKDPNIFVENQVESVEALLEKLGLVASEAYVPANKDGLMAVDAITVTYYYIRKTSVKVTYVYKNNDEMLTEVKDGIEQESTEYIYGHEGESYKAEPKQFAGYSIYEQKYPENETGIMEITTDSDGKVTTESLVTYYYIKVSAGVIERHYDIKTGQLIDAEIVHKGDEEDSYDIKTQEIEGYDIVTKDSEGNSVLPNNSTGIMTVDPIIVNYYYIRKTKVVVEYLDRDTTGKIIEINKETGAEKDSTVIIEGHEGDSYTTTPKVFDTYILTLEPDNKSGVMTVVRDANGTVEATTYVRYYYADTRIQKTENVPGPQPSVSAPAPVETPIKTTTTTTKKPIKAPQKQTEEVKKEEIEVQGPKMELTEFLNTGSFWLEIIKDLIILIIVINFAKLAVTKVSVVGNGRHDIVKVKIKRKESQIKQVKKVEIRPSTKTGKRSKEAAKTKKKQARIAKY